MKKKGYLIALFLLIGIFAFSKPKKTKKGRVIVDYDQIENATAEIGSSLYLENLVTPIYTFKQSIKLGILDFNEQTNYYKVQFFADNTLKTGYIEANNVNIK